MVSGQSLDLLCTGGTGGEGELREIYRNKTGRLIAAPVVMAAVLAGGDVRRAEEFGLALGDLFQLTDDILDAVGSREALGKSVGKDVQEDKLTAVKVYGLTGAREHSEACADRCLDILHTMAGTGTAFLSEFVGYVSRRDR